jgi:pyrrolidone-carboxylate peptidase
VLYVAHGQLLTAATDGAFIRGEQLIVANQPWTEAVGLSVPNTGSNPLKVGVAWILRLFYGRLTPANPTLPIPNTVLKTAKYTDNVFGPIDRAPKFAGSAAIKWTSTQDDRYVDGPGWRQMMQCGLAVDSGTQRVLLYASATARDFVVDPALPVEFAPLRGMPNGVSRKASFFDEPGLFGVFQLEHDQTHDGATTVRTLQLAQSAKQGYAPTSALLLGLTKAEFDSLVALDGGISKDYLRTLLLGDETAIADPDRSATRYTVGIQGLKSADGTYASLSSSVKVYTVDGLLFASKAFADAEPLPTNYARNYEEAIGARDWPQRERKIASVDGNDIVIANVDWRQEVVAGAKLGIIKAGAVDATFDVGFVSMNGNDTVISLIPNPPAAAASAKAFTLTRKVEDRMIDLDQADPVLGISTTRSLVDAFVAALDAIPNDASAKNAIAAKIDDQGAKILERARALAKSDRAHAEVYERALYWARLRMTVALKSHSLCLASIAARNELVERLEKKSRGYNVSFSAINHKVLLLGFDPFDLHENVERSNPSGAVALALHDQLIAVQGKNAIISSAILPGRYRDFDAGVVEEIVNVLIKAQGGVSMILSLSESDDPVYDLERIAGRRRLGYYDNERMTRPPERIGKDATYKEFYESTLPPSQLVPGSSFLTPPDSAQKLFFNQAYASTDKTFGRASDPKASPGSNANQPAYALNTITGNALDGSSGSYLSNEVFYRIARSREELPGSTKPPTGHLHIPTPTAAKVGIAGVIAEVEKLIERWLVGA